MSEAINTSPQTINFVADRQSPHLLCSKNPATGMVIDEIAVTDAQHLRDIVASARSAQAEWAKKTIKERIAYIKRFSRIILDNIDTVSQSIASEEGKPPFEALATEILPVMELLTYYTRLAPRLLADRPVRLHTMKNQRSLLHYAPLGVVGIIAPWNYPFSISLSEAIPALIAGNAIIIKPSEMTPLLGRQIQEFIAAAELPQELFQVVQGDGKIGNALLRAGLDKVVFTGGGATAKHVLTACADTLTPVVCELGGKDAMIICADADIERAARAAVWGAFANAGQMCASVERVYIHTSIAERVIERIVVLTRQLRVGSSNTSRVVDVGPMINERQLLLVEQHIQDACMHGAKILLGAERRPDASSLFYPPTILCDVTPSMLIQREETFGPTMTISIVSTEDELVRLVNDSSFGLSASIFSQDTKHARALARQLAVGTVMINDVICSYGSPEVPWGGVKQSGLGRVHGGAQGIRQFCQERHIMTNIMPFKQEFWWFPYQSWKYRCLKKVIRWLYRLRSR